VSLLALAGARSLPVVSTLPGIGGQRAADLPDRVLVSDRVPIDRERLAAYDRLCGFPLRDRLPVTYPQLLAFPLALELLCDPAFPFAPVGLVHIENRIVQHRAIDASEPLAISVRACDLRPHRRGRQFDLVCEVRAAGELVWEGVSTNLRVERSADQAGRDAPPAEQAGRDAPPAERTGDDSLKLVARWSLPADLGRRYAAVSGDYNPIHLHPLTARLLGFPAAIAHGMWTAARTLAAVGSMLPERCEIEVAFKRPILLPATVELLLHADGRDDAHGGTGGDHAHDGTGGGRPVRFAVRDARTGTPHLEGTARPLPGSPPA
jgi:acyl dehydratase